MDERGGPLPFSFPVMVTGKRLNFMKNNWSQTCHYSLIPNDIPKSKKVINFHGSRTLIRLDIVGKGKCGT